MTVYTLRTILMFISLGITFFSGKLFKQHEKRGRMICGTILVVAYLLTYLF